MTGSKEYNFQLKQHERFGQQKYNYIQYDNHLSSQLFLTLRRSILKVQDDSLKATELVYKSIGLLAKFVIVTFLFILSAEISKSQNDMADRCVLITDCGKNVERRKQRRSQSDTAINVTSRVSILLCTVSNCKSCLRVKYICESNHVHSGIFLLFCEQDIADVH